MLCIEANMSFDQILDLTADVPVYAFIIVYLVLCGATPSPPQLPTHSSILETYDYK